MSDCPFCKRIAAGEYESFTADPTVVWFEPLSPVTPGHMLFLPVRHVEDALADPYTSAITMEIASRWWSKKWSIRSGERDCNLITSVGAAATQSVRHLHIHLVPRRAGDGLALPWTGQQRAQLGKGSPSGSPGLSQDTREGQERTEPLSAADAYMAGVKAERERIAQLAEERDASYDLTKPCGCGRTHPGTGRPCTALIRSGQPFADLIREGDDG